MVAEFMGYVRIPARDLHRQLFTRPLFNDSDVCRQHRRVNRLPFFVKEIRVPVHRSEYRHPYCSGIIRRLDLPRHRIIVLYTQIGTALNRRVRVEAHKTEQRSIRIFGPVYHFRLGKICGVIQRGAHLGDSSAFDRVIHSEVILIGMLITRFGIVCFDRIHETEYFTGHDHEPVQLLDGDLNILFSVFNESCFLGIIVDLDFVPARSEVVAEHDRLVKLLCKDRPLAGQREHFRSVSCRFA